MSDTTTPKLENPNAFPCSDVYHPNGQIEYGAPGMTLRDWFAGKALPYIIEEMWGTPDGAQEIAECAYQIADAMLAARSISTPSRA